MNTLAALALLLLLLVMFHNWRQGTLGMWFKAKFLNQGASTAQVAAGAVKKAQGG